MVLSPWSRGAQDSGMGKFLPAIMALMVVSLGLQIAGYVTPGWLAYSWEKFDGTQFWIGLWYMKVCPGPPPVLVCETRPLSQPDNSNHCYDIPHNMGQYQVETTLAMLAGLFALVFSWDLCRTNNREKQTVAAIAPLCLISGLLSITAAGTAFDSVRKGRRLFSNSDCTNPFKFPYSPVLTCVGGALILVVAVAFFFLRRKEDIKEPDGKRLA